MELEMELKTAIEILEYHQEWRLGKREDMIHEPKKLTQALDIVLNEVKKLEAQQNQYNIHDVSVRDFIIGDVVCTNDGRMWVINEIDGDDLLVDGNGKRNYPLDKCDVSHGT